MIADIREEQTGDRTQVRRINEEAFETQIEADLVDRLRESCGNLLSLVAKVDKLPVGHILFSPVTIEAVEASPPGTGLEGMGLGPMAVLPEYQGRGIGSQLVREGLGRLREAEVPFVIVLGHPEYYPRFGFQQASRYGIRCQWEGVPDAAFMIWIFDETGLGNVTGVARYRDEFDQAM